MAARLVLALVACFVVIRSAAGITLSSRLVHRFSDEARAVRASRSGNATAAAGWWPERRSLEYYRMLASSDVQRQKMKLGLQYQLLVPSEGGQSNNLGNYFGWLFYTWLEIGTPNVSFLVALDTGSDLLWIPCGCMQCAPLSASYYGSLDKDLNQYDPSNSTTSKLVPCSNPLCEQNSSCESPTEQCTYYVKYYTEDTSTSGLLVEDTLHLVSGSDQSSNASVQASVIIGCGMKQSGGYLDGIAPDGLLGLGLGDISVPSYLAKTGMIPNSFSLCFDESGSGRILFGDEGPATQQSTPFLPLNGKYSTYIVGVEACCIGNYCMKETSFRTLIDSGTSFTFIPSEVYKSITTEFDSQINATRTSFGGYPWNYCYKQSSGELPKVPSITLVFPVNNSFVVHDPVFHIRGKEGVIGFCLAVQSIDDDIGVIGQNYMTGYRMVFDRENLRLRWSQSNCQDHRNTRMPVAKGSPNPLPTDEQQRAGRRGTGIAPAIAGRTPVKTSAASALLISNSSLLRSVVLLLPLHGLVFNLHSAHWRWGN